MKVCNRINLKLVAMFRTTIYLKVIFHFYLWSHQWPMLAGLRLHKSWCSLFAWPMGFAWHLVTSNECSHDIVGNYGGFKWGKLAIIVPWILNVHHASCTINTIFVTYLWLDIICVSTTLASLLLMAIQSGMFAFNILHALTKCSKAWKMFHNGNSKNVMLYFRTFTQHRVSLNVMLFLHRVVLGICVQLILCTLT